MNLESRINGAVKEHQKKMSEQKTSKIFCEQDISTVCDTLLTLETVVLTVGIPIVPLSKFRAKLKQSYFSPQDDYIKSALVTVSTAHLVEFLEIMTKSSNDSKNFEHINNRLAVPHNFDYIFLPLIVGATIFSFVSSLILTQGTPTMNPILSAGFSALGASASSLFTLTNKYRFMTFKHIIESEISRREGNICSFNTSKIPLVSLNAIQD